MAAVASGFARTAGALPGARGTLRGTLAAQRGPGAGTALTRVVSRIAR